MLFVRLGLEIRAKLWHAAQAAATALGSHHDKDFWCVTLLLVETLRKVSVIIWRVNSWGQLELDRLAHPNEERTVTVQMHRAFAQGATRLR